MTRRARRLTLTGGGILVVASAACAPRPSPRGAEDSAGADVSPAATDTARNAGGVPDSTALARLEREARALARADGCESSGQCRTAPVGSRPCGGPRDYVVYCALSTDSAALFGKLDELARAEDAYNKASGMMSTCEFRTPPAVEASGGRCVAR